MMTLPLNEIRVVVAAGVLALVAAGCASGTTLGTSDDRAGTATIYRISEAEAFTTALAAYAALLPRQSVDDIVEGTRRGYNADLRFGMDWWSYQILVVPATGTDPSGQEITGYWYAYSGSGSMFLIGGLLRPDLLQWIASRLKATSVVVTNLRGGQYETDGRAYLGLKRDARDIRIAPRQAPTTPTMDRLDELKALRDRGLITEEEYQAKRRQILDRM